jgi:quercetin dioxygenase-like cupin family protein
MVDTRPINLRYWFFSDPTNVIKPGDILDLSPIGATFYVKKTSIETEGYALEMEWLLAPRSSGTPIHVHPSATESYEVMEGELELYVDGSWQRLSVGQKASVAPGIPHTFRNASSFPARVYNTHSPAMRFGEYFGAIDRIVSSRAVPPGRMTPKAALYLAMLMTKFEAEIKSVQPPHGVVRLLSRVARVLGYRVPEVADESSTV